MNTNTIDLKAAARHFAATDPVMAQLLRNALTAPRPIMLPQQKPVNEYFSTIVTSIISQQISTKAADAVRGRVVAHLGGAVTPETVMRADFDELKSCGLSNQKTKYLKHNAEVWSRVPSHEFATMDNEAVITELTKLYGIGRWTAEMFLIFSLARADVFSYGDLGLMKGLYLSYHYKPHYVRKIKTTVDNWSPHQTTASLALWFVLDNGPVLL
jgi:DNA-3-methyladenine glycosylase II